MSNDNGGVAGSDEGLADAVVQLAFAAMGVLNKAASDNDLSLTQLRVIGILQDRRLRMSALAEFLGLEKSTMSGLVVRAEKRGLLQRVPSADDGRAVDVAITADGAAQAARVRETVATALAPLLDGLAAGERGQLQTLLERMLAPQAPAAGIAQGSAS